MKIINKKIIGRSRGIRIVQMEVEAPLIARNFLPGQFVLVMAAPAGERVPLTIAGRNLDKGTITILFQESGYSTKLLGALPEGRSLFAVSGPLGRPAHILERGRVLVIGGGVGIAEVYPVAEALARNKVSITSIIGAKTKALLILKDAIRELSGKTFIATDDGSIGREGFVTDILEDILGKDSGFNLVYCVGPVEMMRRVAQITKQYGIKTTVSLSAIMLDGTGMCGSCRVRAGGETKLCCVDGPDFDAHLVDFDHLQMRQNRFIKKEKELLRKI